MAVQVLVCVGVAVEVAVGVGLTNTPGSHESTRLQPTINAATERARAINRERDAKCVRPPSEPVPGIYSPALLLRAGKSITSRMDVLSVKSIVIRSMPMPSPPVGGMPCSRARIQSSSIGWASSSPAFCC